MSGILSRERRHGLGCDLGMESSRAAVGGVEVLMTIAELRDRIEASPPGSQIPREWLLEQMSGILEANLDSIPWATIKEGSAITGLSELELRRKAPGWASFNQPEIHVRKMNPEKLRSNWLFSEDDCEAYRERHEGERSGSEIVSDNVDDPLDMDALKDQYGRKVTANL